jgi:flagellin-like hook-associated protein FlgL
MASDAKTTTPPSVNPDLKAVHTQLIAVANELEAAIGRAKTAAEVNAILDEIIEVNARVTTVGRQLFTQQTAQIRTRAEVVMAGVEEVKAEIKRLDGVKELVQNVTKFLGLVDRVVDMAKLVI